MREAIRPELRTDSYAPQPVRQVRIAKADKPGEWRTPGIPTIHDRVCQHALLNRLEPIFEPVFDDANFGYRRGRSGPGMDRGRRPEGLLRVRGSREAPRARGPTCVRWQSCASLAGSYGQGRLFPSERGTPQGGVVSPLLSNILLTPFDREMRSKGYQLTRYADDWVITCSSRAQAHAAVAAATKILTALGVQLHPQKTRIVHVQFGFEFLGYKIKRGRRLSLPAAKIRSGARSGGLYAYPREKSVQRFMDQVRRLTKRR